MTRNLGRLRRASLAAAVLLLAAPPAHAQLLKLAGLVIPSDLQPGRWVSYHVVLESRNRPPRELTQRLAAVAREGVGEQEGVWVELRTTEGNKSRIERGFFAHHLGIPQADRGFRNDVLGISRYEVLTPEGKLFEYPVGSETATGGDEDISAMSAFEFLPMRAQDRDSLPPDTLRVANKVLPCTVERLWRVGSEPWDDPDTSFVNRAVMAQMAWKNPGVPLTGYARLVVEVSTQRVPAHETGDPDPRGILSDSTATSPRITKGKLVYRSELRLVDIGKDAVPEITQEPEPGPAEEPSPRTRVIR